ncbi:MAG: FKBP-type peptidyl-prolyl cis-trans isomerase [Acidimicrobiales bacterium]
MSDNRTCAKDGDTVSVHYTGTLDDGSQFDSSTRVDPLQFAVGSGQVVRASTRPYLALPVGESKKARMEAADAYGEHRADIVITVPADQAPEGLKVGDQVAAGGQPATVVSVDEQSVTIDANHQLAGQALTFDVELVSFD